MKMLILPVKWSLDHLERKGLYLTIFALCADVGSSFTQGIAIAAAIQGKPMKEIMYQQARFNTGSHSGACFTCGKLGHRAAQCPCKGESENSNAPAKKASRYMS